ncbi:sulfite exporter TauE/SafE family protein [Alteromonas sp. ASW11-130]|uniref:sulfite exporter TauE/SafE family protein n=1 Tax=Alteromonas sp. ASW11-130 TaxID=3015775 RepID=UPI002241B5A0|nr:sulfite exporter TauE/SafE family protein [Alteromonas sp. ASW11-130]MCW8093172.1 sulfite exporter TauE/SafE family protein [Alteromonas sp. ASW11-130]
MVAFIEWLGAGEIPLAVILLLALSSAVTSFVTAAFGIGGGILLLAIMAHYIPIEVLIPVHGMVQLGSNGYRTYKTRIYLDKNTVTSFGLGAVVGAIVVSFVLIQLPLQWIQLTVGLFILYLLWGFKPSPHQISAKGMFSVGTITTMLSTFVGATGPLLAAFMHQNQMGKMVHTATFASCMSVQNLLKLAVFWIAGVYFFAWLPLTAVMIVTGFIGTKVGLMTLEGFSTQLFKLLYTTVVTLLAFHLLIKAAFQIF